MEIAGLGDIIEYKGKEGKVLSVLQNSVVVDFTYDKNFENSSEEPDKTVLNHKKYKIVRSEK